MAKTLRDIETELEGIRTEARATADDIGDAA